MVAVVLAEWPREVQPRETANLAQGALPAPSAMRGECLWFRQDYKNDK